MVPVHWYLRYSLWYRDVEELLAERGIEVDIDAGTNRCSTSPSARPRTCGADAAARYSDPAPPPAQGFAMSGDDIVVISPCTQVLSDYRLVLRSVVPSSPQSHRQSLLNVSLVSSGSSLRSRVHQEPNCETPGRADTDFGHVVLRVRAVAVVLGHGPAHCRHVHAQAGLTPCPWRQVGCRSAPNSSGALRRCRNRIPL
jgi:hypothetical protein